MTPAEEAAWLEKNIPARTPPPQPALAGGAPAAVEPSRAAGGPGSAAHQPCTHHYICAPPDGEFSRGECKHCHKVRFFKNAEAFTLSPHQADSARVELSSTYPSKSPQ